MSSPPIRGGFEGGSVGFSDLTVRSPGFPGLLRSRPSAGVLQSGSPTVDFQSMGGFPRASARGGDSSSKEGDFHE
ncbi:MAG: hypothetical protein CMJ54_02045 [Planctomycetaceae bacterium]|nr:hypothetical protein [Planctomycetaceae bacterium]